MNIILCGLQHCGKTNAGKRLALELGYPFIDTDQLIETAYTTITAKNKNCRQICFEHGESFFRQLEKQQIQYLKHTKNSIISCGGGSLCMKENVEMFKSLGNMIYLKIPTEIIWERIITHGIPSYLDSNDPKASFFAIAASRLPIYEAAADIIIEVNLLSPEHISAKILARLATSHSRSIKHG